MSTQPLADVPAMAFYHQDGLIPSWQQASRFAGEGGRIATLPDIIDARLATDIGATPWETHFTTASAEYLGYSKGGVLILIVAHGVGPMVTLDGVIKAYSYQFKDKTRTHRGGRISATEFRKLENGDYGPVEIVELAAVLNRYKYPFIEVLQVDDALSDPLVLARLGSRADEYIERHADEARIWHAEQQHHTTGREAALHRVLSRSAAHPYILANKDGSFFYEQYQPEDGLAGAHLLSIGGLTYSNHQDKSGSYMNSLISDIGCHGWSDGTRMVGARTQDPLTMIHPGPGNLSQLARRRWRTLMQPCKAKPLQRLQALIKVDEETWFTQRPKVGAGLDTHEPEFRVTDMEPVGDFVEFKTPVLGYHGFFKYDLQTMQSFAPPQANAYVVMSEPQLVWECGEPKYQTARVQFYRIEADTTQRLLQVDELKNSFDLVMSLLEQEEAASS